MRSGAETVINLVRLAYCFEKARSDDALLLTKQVQGLDRLFGQTDYSFRRKHFSCSAPSCNMPVSASFWFAEITRRAGAVQEVIAAARRSAARLSERK